MLGIWSEIDLLVNPFSETAYSKGNVLVACAYHGGCGCAAP